MSDIKRLAVLGSTGSIGRQTLEVVRAFPQRFKIVGLAAGGNTGLLEEQVREFKPEFVYSRDGCKAPAETNFLPMDEIAAHPSVDTVVVATPGGAGLIPTLAAVRAGKNIAMANKESLVTAGEIITREAKKYKANIVPVDSEHSAIWQCLSGEKTPPSRIILTASGGPFRGCTIGQMEKVTPEQALRHPSWKMGKKVTIDSATLLNKGLEVMEARWLFDVTPENISILVHPQSIVHSFVEFPDGSAKAQLGCPDMRLPIQYALTWPERLPNPALPKLDWDTLRSLDFEPPDLAAFPCLRLAIEAGKAGGTCPAVLCAADEVAVGLFLGHKLKFTGIAELIEKVLERHRPISKPTIEEINAADTWARDEARRLAAENK
jgi:1-deoxy-D-xylulose-5-phosphate reductoisomerase